MPLASIATWSIHFSCIQRPHAHSTHSSPCPACMSSSYVPKHSQHSSVFINADEAADSEVRSAPGDKHLCLSLHSFYPLVARLQFIFFHDLMLSLPSPLSSSLQVPLFPSFCLPSPFFSVAFLLPVFASCLPFLSKLPALLHWLVPSLL